MKKLLVALVALIALAVIAILALPFAIPTETAKREIAERVRAATGRELVIEGDLVLRVVPRLSAHAADVRFANAPGGRVPEMARLASLEVEIATWPLLRGLVEVRRFVLHQPEIHLEIDAQGRPNWLMPVAVDAAEAGVPRRPTQRRMPLADLALGEVRIEDGRITYHDARDGTEEVLEQVTGRLSLADLRSPLAAALSLRLRDRPVDLTLDAERPLALLERRASPIRLTADAPDLRAVFDGDLDLDSGRAEGAIEVASGDLRALAAWLDRPLAITGEDVGAASLAGRIEGDATRLRLTLDRLTLDAIEGEGEITARLDGPRPRIDGHLDVGHVALDRYFSPRPDAADRAEETPPPVAEDRRTWSEDPIALPLPLAFDGALALTVAGLELGELTLGAGALDLRIEDAHAQAEITRLELYGGTASGRISLAGGADQQPRLEQALRLDDVATRPLLEALVGVDRIEGTARGEVVLRSAGRSQRELIEALAGEGRITIEDGAIIGVNLAAMARDLVGAFIQRGPREARRTDFAILTGSFTIEDGMVANDDLLLRAPLVELTGSGAIDLPNRAIPSYVFEPRARASLEGQDAREAAAATLVPIEVSGPWDDLTWSADLQGALEGVTSDPERLRENLDRLRDGAREGVRGLIEGLGFGR